MIAHSTYILGLSLKQERPSSYSSLFFYWKLENSSFKSWGFLLWIWVVKIIIMITSISCSLMFVWNGKKLHNKVGVTTRGECIFWCIPMQFWSLSFTVWWIYDFDGEFRLRNKVFASISGDCSKCGEQPENNWDFCQVAGITYFLKFP